MMRWYLVFWAFGLALIHNSISSSPISEFQDEWETFNAILRDPAFRLPTTTRPEHYKVSLTPYFETEGPDAFTFDGEVTVYLRANETDVQEIVMHCNDLTIESLVVTNSEGVEVSEPCDGTSCPQCDLVHSFLRIATTVPLDLDQTYIVMSTFRGRLQTNMRGFYRSWYYDSSGNKRWMGTTQFQPGHARQAFPCYDEPSFKATFDITIVREVGFSKTLSNMPLKSSEDIPVPDGVDRVAETFHTTPKTSSYLLAFIVSHYIDIAKSEDEDRPFVIYARDNVGETGQWSLDVGVKLLEAMEEYTGISYYEMSEKDGEEGSNMDMKQAAIPDFSAGAMENWGLLTYREALILYDPANSNHFYKQRVANIVSHEIAHMWFGNLVTCAWWDNLWLNEGFARFYQYYLTEMVEPELGYDTRFIVEQVHTAMFSDSTDDAHALTNPAVGDPTSVSAHFSHITYARGAAVIRMIQYLLGKDTFVKGLRIYLQDRKFDVAEPHHLFEALDAAAEEDNALAAYGGITISKLFPYWSEQAGHPLLTVVVNQATGRMFVTQERWERTTGVSAHQTLRYVPVTWTRGGAPDFDNLKPSNILTGTTSVLERGTQNQLEWVIFNIQQTGFYRVNYDDDNWGLLTLALRSDDRTVIHEHNRAQIVDDLFALARSGNRIYTMAFNILSFLEFEDAYAPWLAAISGYNFLRRRLAHDHENLQKLQDLIIGYSTAVTTRLGFADRPDESYMDGLLRMYVMSFLCNIGHVECLSNAKTHFRAFMNDKEYYIPPNMRPWVYCTGLRHGDAEDYIKLWEHYVEFDLASEKIVVLEALGCTRDKDSLEHYLDHVAANDDSIRPQDFNTALNSATSGNEENTMIVLDWLESNMEVARTTLGSLTTLLSYISARLLNEEDISKFEDFIENHQAELGDTTYNDAINGVATARANLQWSEERTPEMVHYFEHGFQEVFVILPTEPPTEGPTDPPTEGPTDPPTEGPTDPPTEGPTDPPTEGPTNPPTEVTTEEPEDDSANIANLGILTLLITLSINIINF